MKFHSTKTWNLKIPFSSLFTLVFLVFSTDALFAKCPDESKKETLQDCPWADVARRINDHESRDKVKDSIPEFNTILQNLEQDGSNTAATSLWGTSINFDEMMKQVVVEPEMLSIVLTTAKKSPETKDHHVHAGIEHTYGYLFSNLLTSFGYKRARWVSNELNEAFGFEGQAISPLPKVGSLFQNVTYLFGSIAFRQDSQALKVLQDSVKSVEPSVRDLNYAALNVRRLVETLELDSGRKINIFTDIVGFKNQPANTSNAALLVYSISDSSNENASGTTRLITGFPVASGFADKVFDPENLGSNKTIVTRYNAFLDGVTGVNPPLKGTRSKSVQ